PGIGTDHARWLLDQLGGHAGVMCRRGDQIEPFPLVLRRSTRHVIREMIEGGERSVRSLSRSVCALLSPAWPQDAWTNLNRPEDLSSWRAKRSGQPGAP